MGIGWDLTRGAFSASYTAAERITTGIAQAVGRSSVRPSRRAIRTGILAPGDSPPSGTTQSFLDYREVLLPQQLGCLSAGQYQIGSVRHPQLGEQNSYPVFLDINDLARHSAIVGPSGAGKTYSLIAPWICSSASLGLSAVAVDAKGDLLLEMAGAKKRMGVNATFPLIRWDVLDPRESASWNPLAEVDSPAAAAQLANAFLGESSDSDHAGKYFSERDNRWLRGAILLAVRAFRHPPHPAVL